jgi:hypothetical protein
MDLDEKVPEAEPREAVPLVAPPPEDPEQTDFTAAEKKRVEEEKEKAAKHVDGLCQAAEFGSVLVRQIDHGGELSTPAPVSGTHFPRTAVIAFYVVTAKSTGKRGFQRLHLARLFTQVVSRDHAPLPNFTGIYVERVVSPSPKVIPIRACLSHMLSDDGMPHWTEVAQLDLQQQEQHFFVQQLDRGSTLDGFQWSLFDPTRRYIEKFAEFKQSPLQTPEDVAVLYKFACGHTEVGEYKLPLFKPPKEKAGQPATVFDPRIWTHWSPPCVALENTDFMRRSLATAQRKIAENNAECDRIASERRAAHHTFVAGLREQMRQLT